MRAVIDGTDISAEMLQAAKKKKDHDLVDWKVMDMCDFQVDVSYDGILCLCDSFNYLLKKEQVQKLFTQVKSHLTKDGVFIMDMHSMDRLLEFAEEYNEAGRIDHHEYQWTIQTIEDCIYQNFAFYDEAKTAYCIISTSEKALYANVMLQKGVVIND